jgi:hypothetical protein
MSYLDFIRERVADIALTPDNAYTSGAFIGGRGRIDVGRHVVRLTLSTFSTLRSVSRWLAQYGILSDVILSCSRSKC